MINIATIDQYVAQHGRFCLLDWLLADNLLFYSDYENWRYGKLEFLTDKLQFELSELVALMESVKNHCQSLGLVSEEQEFTSWAGDNSDSLRASKNSAYHQSLTRKWLRPQDQPQLDLFMDNSAQLVEGEVIHAIVTRQFDKAQEKLQNLSALNPECSRLGGYQDLINYGSHMLAMPDVAEEALAAEHAGLKEEVVPLAQDVLGADARDYLSFAWRRLANSFGSRFDPAQAELSVSAALLEIPDYAEALKNLEASKQLYQEPILLERYAICLSRLHQKEKALLVWCLLLELDASYAESALDNHTSETIHALWQDYWELNDEWSSEFFPAYVLIRNPALIYSLESLLGFKNESTLATIALLKTRASGGSEIEARGELQRISPELLKIYLRFNKM